MDKRPEDRPVFGREPEEGECARRPGVYAVILDGDRLAAIRTGRGYFLPGGGAERDETPGTTLRREAREKCGTAIEVGRKIGEAVEYIYAEAEGRYYRIEGTFFEATLGDRIASDREPDHEPVWLDAHAAIGLLNRKSQAWAVQRAIDASSG